MPSDKEHHFEFDPPLEFYQTSGWPCPEGHTNTTGAVDHAGKMVCWDCGRLYDRPTEKFPDEKN